VNVAPFPGSLSTVTSASIARQLARAMDADVTVDSEPGNGATFTVRLRALRPLSAVG
jgi:light-regulated signal transduction histidine kinase (bacteriophytochrome)